MKIEEPKKIEDSMKIYKILTVDEWKMLETEKVFLGSPVDRKDGFIHFSAAEQVVETANKHFAGQSSLMLLQVDANAYGDRLKWEPSRGGDLFPHLYDDLKLEDVVRYDSLLVDANQSFIFPDDVLPN